MLPFDWERLHYIRVEVLACSDGVLRCYSRCESREVDSKALREDSHRLVGSMKYFDSNLEDLQSLAVSPPTKGLADSALEPEQWT